MCELCIFILTRLWYLSPWCEEVWSHSVESIASGCSSVYVWCGIINATASGCQRKNISIRIESFIDMQWYFKQFVLKYQCGNHFEIFCMCVTDEPLSMVTWNFEWRNGVSTVNTLTPIHIYFTMLGWILKLCSHHRKKFQTLANINWNYNIQQQFSSCYILG